MKEAPATKLQEFVRRDEEIGKKEYHPAEQGFAFSYVSGPLYRAWMDEINVFYERYLKGHPMHDQIFQTYFHRRNRPSAYEDIMGHLHALSADDEFKVKITEEGWKRSSKIELQQLAECFKRILIVVIHFFQILRMKRLDWIYTLM